MRAVLRFLEVDDTLPIESVEANPTRAACARSASTSWCTRCRSGRGPVSRAAKARGQGADAAQAAARGAASHCAPRGLRRAAAARRAPHARAAPALQGRGRGAQRVPRIVTSSRCGAMTASAELAAQRACARQRLPDFFIVGHAKSGTTALYEMLRRHPQIYMPELKEPWFFATDLRSRASRRGRRGDPDDARGVPGSCSPAAPGQRVGEASSSYLWSRTAAARIAELQPRRAHHRDPARARELPALAASAAAADPRRDRERPAQGDRAGGATAPGQADPAPLAPARALLYSEHVRYVEQLRRYHALSRRAGAGADLRRLPRRQRGDGAQGAALPGGRRRRSRSRSLDANPTVRVRSQHLDELVHAVSVGAGPAARGREGAVKALTPRRLRTAPSRQRTNQRRLRRARARRTRAS